MNIKIITYSDIPESFKETACKERLSFLAGEDIHYWGAFVDGQLVGTTCLVIYKNGHGKIKSNYVLLEFREQGIFSALNTACLDFARELGIKNITLNCLEDSVAAHVKAGAVIWKESKTIKYLVYRFK
jgi:hypothetical protein